MSSITDKMNYLQDTKKQIKDAIIGKGVAVEEGDTFRSYAQKISQIQQEGTTDYNFLENKPIINLTGSEESPILSDNLEVNKLYKLNGKINLLLNLSEDGETLEKIEKDANDEYIYISSKKDNTIDGIGTLSYDGIYFGSNNSNNTILEFSWTIEKQSSQIIEIGKAKTLSLKSEINNNIEDKIISHIYNDLDSTSVTDSLSANMGKLLQGNVQFLANAINESNTRIEHLETLVATFPGAFLTFEQVNQKLVNAIGGQENVKEGYSVWLGEYLVEDGLNSYYEGYVTEQSTTHNVMFINAYASAGRKIEAEGITNYLINLGLINHDDIDVGMAACFGENAEIKTLNGYKKIIDIKLGDTVYSYQKNQEVPSIVKEINIHNNALDIYKLDINGKELFVTADHSVLTINNKFQKIKDVLENSIPLYNKTILKGVKTKDIMNMYDIVTDKGNYIVSEFNIIAKSEKIRKPNKVIKEEKGKININDILHFN